MLDIYQINEKVIVNFTLHNLDPLTPLEDSLGRHIEHRSHYFASIHTGFYGGN